MTSIRTLLSGCIDYAGLFPPAALDVAATLANYAAYRRGPDAWALGKLILPAAKLQTFTDEFPDAAREWWLTVIVRGESEHQVRTMLNTSEHAHRATFECGPLLRGEISALAASIRNPAMVFVEVDLSSEIEQSIAAITAAGMRAKIRTGGITVDAIPAPELVARFIRCCIEHGVAFKATAGLHHAMRGVYPLSYDQDSPRATMYGFLNVLLASALLAEDTDMRTAIELLEETSFRAFEIEDCQVRWRKHRFSVQALAQVRSRLMLSFGSCSFVEPMSELRAVGLIV